MRSTEVPDWVTFPDSNWEAITPGDAGLDQEKFQRFLANLNARGAAKINPLLSIPITVSIPLSLKVS